MRKLFTILFITVTLSQFATAQQDPMFTKYMFNSLVFNPGYAGSHEYLSLRALYRKQWWSFDGGPTTQTVTAHTPIKESVGVGISLLNDEIGATASSTANISYAYRLKFEKGKLSIGLQGGLTNMRSKWSELNFKDPVNLDESYDNNPYKSWLPNFGAGVFYYSPIWYAGFSVPHLINWDLRKDVTTNKSAKLYRHYYFTAGAAFPLKGNGLIFKPSILIKSVELFSRFSGASSLVNTVGAPTEFDIDLSFMFFEALWVGASFRSSFEGLLGDSSSIDSGDIWASYYLDNGFRIGASYDYTLTKLQSHIGGTFEIMLGYDFNYNVNQINTPRYF